MSLPLWECGLKFNYTDVIVCCCFVTPLVGVWIEMQRERSHRNSMTSLPLWECGLKFFAWHGKIACS